VSAAAKVGKKAMAPESLANLRKGGETRRGPAKVTTTLKEAILLAATKAGGKEGLVGYLHKQAVENPQSFLPLIGRVLPLTIGGDADNPIKVEVGSAIAKIKADVDAVAQRIEDGSNS
jgi:hypothetical protein